LPTPLDLPRICDAVFATVVADDRGQAAVLCWARSRFFGTPLVLLDWGVSQLAPGLWAEAQRQLLGLAAECRARHGSVGLHVEDESLAAQAEDRGVLTTPIYEHLTARDRWPSLCLTVSLAARGGRVGVTTRAMATARGHPRREELFTPALEFRGGPRPEVPTVPAFVYGVVLALDPTAATPPRPARVKIAA
jgi:hypothetical protein